MRTFSTKSKHFPVDPFFLKESHGEHKVRAGYVVHGPTTTKKSMILGGRSLRRKLSWQRVIVTGILGFCALYIIISFLATLQWIPRRQITTPRPKTSSPYDYENCGFHQTEPCKNAPSEAPEGYEVLPCDALITQGIQGFCSVLIDGKSYKGMRRSCESRFRFRCEAAFQFADAQAAFGKFYKLLGKMSTEPEGLRSGARGIIFPATSKMLPGVYANVKLLRELGCKLPIEIWCLSGELTNFDPVVRFFTQQLGCTLRIAPQHELKSHYYIKIHAILNSGFEEILLLDADNIPARDPTYLFETPEFQETGAVFWPDFWHPNHTMFDNTPHNLIWELLDIPFEDMFEQESGQILINRRKNIHAQKLLRFYSENPLFFRENFLVHGDKDLFRLAWMKTRSAYHMIETPPDTAGEMRDGQYCGSVLVQHDPDGEIVFFHRNQGKVYDPNFRRAMWSHLQMYRGVSTRSTYMISFPRPTKDEYTCYNGDITNPDFYVVPMEETEFADLEDRALFFVEEFYKHVYTRHA